jgi:glycosyltransferase involved in cell wall biosynthesis
VRDGESGLLVPARSPAQLAQALARVLQDRDLAARLGGNAQVVVAQRHSPHAAVERIGHIYRDLGLAAAGASRTTATAHT